MGKSKIKQSAQYAYKDKKLKGSRRTIPITKQ